MSLTVFDTPHTEAFDACLSRLRAAAAYAWEAPPLRPSMVLATPERCAWMAFNSWLAPPYAFVDVPADGQAAAAVAAIRETLGQAAHQGRAARLLHFACLALIEARAGLGPVIQRSHAIRALSDTPLTVLLLTDADGVAVTVCAARTVGAWAPLDALADPPFLASAIPS